ncbi:MAG: undecaprenyl-diphosphatase UppP [Bacteroidetes bacterium]|nr:undecaprenyl-diphosphatase UppP [Bacteroidota bacterium]
MNILWAILLGIIQGLTEFLPISSTAHLTIAGKLLGLVDLDHPEAWTAFIAVMQLGTMAAVLVYFWKDLLGVVLGVIRDLFTHAGERRDKGWSQESRLALAIILGTIPVGLVGFLFRHQIEGVFTKSTLVITGSLVGLAALLWLADKVARHERTIRQVRWWDALLVGCAQALALIPGSSRSGTTITAALFLGFTREAAARFSFLLSVPAVLASGFFEIYKIADMHQAGTDVFQLGVANLAVATVVSGISGYMAIAWLLKYLMKHTTLVFVWYRILLGVVLSILLLTGMILP